MDAMLDPIYRLLLFHLHRVAQTQRPEKQLLTLLRGKNGGVTLLYPHTQLQTARKLNTLTLASGPGDVSIISIPEAPGITWQKTIFML